MNGCRAPGADTVLRGELGPMANAGAGYGHMRRSAIYCVPCGISKPWKLSWEMVMDEYIVFWIFPSAVSDDTHFETYRTLDEANTALAEFARCHPHNTYRLARTIGQIPATAEQPKPRARIITIIESGHGSGGSVEINGSGQITAVRITAP